MTDSEFREDVKAAIRKHDPGADDLRDLAADLEDTAARYEALEEGV